MNRINPVGGVPIDPRIGRTDPVGTAGQAGAPAQKPKASAFQEILRHEIGRGQDLRLSAHARDRLASRNIQLTPEAMGRLSEAVDRAAAKGARDALLLMPGASRREDLALVVSVTNRTVITAVDGEHMKENVFTNIDSAIVVQ